MQHQLARPTQLLPCNLASHFPSTALVASRRQCRLSEGAHRLHIFKHMR